MLKLVLEMLKEVVEQEPGKNKDGNFIVLVFAILCVGIVLSFNFLNEEIKLNKSGTDTRLTAIENRLNKSDTFIEILKDRAKRKP
jgi:hypothetical protein